VFDDVCPEVRTATCRVPGLGFGVPAGSGPSSTPKRNRWRCRTGPWRTSLPFCNAREREQAGRQHRLFFSQVEFCDNLIFRRRAALDMLGERLLDANRTIGRPDRKIPVVFGR
jgi:hypothetical protein